MSIYDKNQKRIREIEAALSKGKIDAKKAAVRIAKLKAKGPEYWVKGYAYKRHYDEPISGDRSSIKAARKYEMSIKVGVEDKTYSPSNLLKVRLREIFQSHLDAQAGKGGYKAAKTRCKHAKHYMGDMRLERLEEAPKAILKALFETTIPVDFPEWKQKTKWQLWSFMKSAIGTYIRENPKLKINNPFNAYPMKPGTETREVYPTLEEHLQVLDHIKKNPAKWVTRPGKGPMKVGYPAYFYPLMVIKYEQGLRGMEIMPWRFEKADFEFIPKEKKPAIQTKILKKGDVKAWQWIVFTPASWFALKTYLDALDTQKEHGKVWPVKNWPTDLARQALDACGLKHLIPHDYRRSWTIENLDKNAERRRKAVGRKTAESEDDYKQLGRVEQEEFYAEEWAQYE